MPDVFREDGHRSEGCTHLGVRLPRNWGWQLYAKSANRSGQGNGLTVMDTIKRLLIWIAVAALVVLAVLLPVVVVTGMFGGKPLAGTIALVGLMLLAFGVAWYVHTQAQRF